MSETALSPYTMKDGWFAPFWYREVNEPFNELFSGNGYYPYEGYDNTRVRVNLKVMLDENNRIAEMSYYKLYDSTLGHGKPVTHDIALTPFDEKKLVSTLTQCTISTGEQELDQLVSAAKDRTLPHGWKIEKITKKSISFKDPSGNIVSISRKRIVQAIDISHSYMDVLQEKEFWFANAKYLNPDDAEPLMDLFSLVDATRYYNYEKLVAEATNRKAFAEKNHRLERITQASEESDIHTIKKELQCIPKELLEEDDLAQAMYNAILHKDSQMAAALIRGGANVNATIKIDEEHHCIMSFIIEEGMDSLLSLCLRNGFEPDSFWNVHLVHQSFICGRPDYAVELLNAGAPLLILKDDIDIIPPELLNRLAQYKSVEWYRDTLDILYKTGKKSLVKKIIKNLHEHQSSELADIVGWILSVGDIGLMKLYISQHYPTLEYNEHMIISSTVCYSEDWAPFFKEGVLFRDEFAVEVFVKKAVGHCIFRRDDKALLFLIDRFHALPTRDQMKTLIRQLGGETEDSISLVQELLQRLRFQDNGEWHGNSDISIEGRHNSKVSHSSVLDLLVYSLRVKNKETIEIATTTQSNLFSESAAFCRIYDAAKTIPYSDIQNKIYRILLPTARIIVSTWDNPEKTSTIPTYDIQKSICLAKELIDGMPGDQV